MDMQDLQSDIGSGDHVFHSPEIHDCKLNGTVEHIDRQRVRTDIGENMRPGRQQDDNGGRQQDRDAVIQQAVESAQMHICCPDDRLQRRVGGPALDQVDEGV